MTLLSIVKALSEVCENDAGEYVHFGATSNDIIDTSQSLLFKESIKILKGRLTELTKTLLELAEENKDKCLHRKNTWTTCTSNNLWNEICYMGR